MKAHIKYKSSAEVYQILSYLLIYTAKNYHLFKVDRNEIEVVNNTKQFLFSLNQVNNADQFC